MRRIETLILPAEPAAPRPPVYHPGESAWATSARLGRWLIGGLTPEQLDETIDSLAASLTDGPTPAEPDGVVKWLADAKATGPVRAYVTPDGDWLLIGEKGFKGGVLGVHNWHLRSERGNWVRVACVNLADAVGAFAITGRADMTLAVCSRRKYGLYTKELGLIAFQVAFRAFASRRMDEEAARAANRATFAHTAGVFEDKLNCDKTHLALAASSRAARHFSHVEIDDEVDVDEFAECDRQLDHCLDHGLLPRIDGRNALRFRKCGRHRAIGLYSPALRAIAVDPRAPKSLLHEMMHAWDWEHDQMSLSKAFAPLMDIQRAGLAGMDLSDSRRAYGLTPTEVFARAGELWAIESGRASSFTSKSVDDLVAFDELCEPLAAHMDVVRAFFEPIDKEIFA